MDGMVWRQFRREGFAVAVQTGLTSTGTAFSFSEQARPTVGLARGASRDGEMPSRNCVFYQIPEIVTPDQEILKEHLGHSR